MTTLLYDTVTADMKDTAVVALVLAVAIAVVAWFAGPFRAPRRMRGFYADSLDALRQNADKHGVTTGRFGTWVYAQRRVLHVIIALAASAAIILLRPLSISDIVGTLAIAVLALIVLSLVERPDRAAAAEPAQTPVAA